MTDSLNLSNVFKTNSNEKTNYLDITGMDRRFIN